MKFKKGLVLNERFYFEIVKPLLRSYDPNLFYSCSLIGYGSDVLGFDDATSMDHNWGPRLQIFLEEADLAQKDALNDYLEMSLPSTFLGFPTSFSEKAEDSTQRMESTKHPPFRHLVEIFGIDAYILSITGKATSDLTNLDWLCIPEQILLETTAGKVFHDGLSKLEPFREFLRYYPIEVRKIKLAALWESISSQEAFLGRCIETSDYIGLKLISAQIVNYLMKICFAITGQYIPYPKWFGKAFKKLGFRKIEQQVTAILKENDFRLVESMVSALYLEIIQLNNRTAGLPKIPNRIKNYHGRPYQVIMADQISDRFVNSL